jgi:hypothetical protein
MRKALLPPLARKQLTDFSFASSINPFRGPRSLFEGSACYGYTIRTVSASATSKQAEDHASATETDSAPPTNISSSLPPLVKLPGRDSSSVLQLESHPKETQRFQEFHVWLQRLQHNQALHDLAGVQQTWQRFKLTGLGLPEFRGPGHDIWRMFLRWPELFAEVVEHALNLHNQTGQPFDSMYAIVVGQLMLSFSIKDRALATRYHNTFVEKRVVTSGGLVKLAEALLAAPNEGVHTDFRRLLSNTPGKLTGGLYDVIISRLCECGSWQDARDWHIFFVRRGEGPKDSNAILNFLKRRPHLNGALFSHARQALERSSSIEPSALEKQQAHGPKLPASDAPGSLGTTTDSTGIQVNDEFCARLFATHAIPISIVVGGLKLFRVESIGTLALRELAVRTRSVAGIKEDLHILKEAGITVRPSIFARLLKKLVFQREQKILDNLLGCDLHPDVFEDADLQQKLLRQYSAQDDWSSSERTLTVLSLLKVDPDSIKGYRRPASRSKSYGMQPKSPWHTRFVEYCRRQDTKQVSTAVDSMLLQKIPITNDCFRALWEHCLRHRAPGAKPVRDFNISGDLAFVSSICVRVMIAGEHVPPWMLKELIIRYGMKLDLRNLSRLSAYIIHAYEQARRNLKSTGSSGLLTNLPKQDMYLAISNSLPQRNPSSYIGQIFTYNTIDAIITWGFAWGGQKIFHKYFNHSRGRARFPTWRVLHEPDAPVPSRTYLRGLMILQQLAQNGLNVQVESVANTVRERLWQLYGLGTSNRRLNRRIRHYNPFTLGEMLVAIEEAWEGPRLFPQLYKDQHSELAGVAKMESGQIVIPREVSAKEISAEAESKPDVPESGLGELMALLQLPRNGKEETQKRKPHVQPDSDRDMGPKGDGPSLLYGLLDSMVPPGAPRLLRDERIEARVKIRLALFGHSGMGRWMRSNQDPDAWGRIVRRMAVEADDVLLRRKLVTELGPGTVSETIARPVYTVQIRRTRSKAP